MAVLDFLLQLQRKACWVMVPLLLPLYVGEQNSSGTETITKGACYGAGQCDGAKKHEQSRPANALMPSTMSRVLRSRH